MVIKYNTARLAKEMGFDVPTFGYYIRLRSGWELQFEDRELGAYNWNEREGISAPEQYELQLWLLKNKIYIDVKYMNFGNDVQKGYYYSIYEITGLTLEDCIYWSDGVYGKDLFSGYDSYEECLENALCQSLLKLK